MQQIVRLCHLFNFSQRFAYCSSLAVYVYSFDDFELKQILSGHEKTIHALAWSPHEPNIIATCSSDTKISIWDLNTESEIYLCQLSDGTPQSLAWSPFEKSVLAFHDERGIVHLTNYDSRAEERAITVKTTGNATHIRWSPSTPGLMAVATEDGTVNIVNTTRPRNAPLKLSPPAFQQEAGKETPGVVDLQWDPLSTNFLLVAYKRGHLVLFDVTQEKEPVLMLFNREAGSSPGMHRGCHTHPPRGIASVAFIPGEPGGFVTAAERTGPSRSGTSPRRDSFAHGCKSDIRPLCFFRFLVCFLPFYTHPRDSCLVFYLSAFAPAPPPPETSASSLSQSGTAAAPSNTHDLRCIFNLVDGTVGVFDLRRRQTLFQTTPGHTETVFDCQFKPSNADVLATSSFDGTIRVWNVETMECIQLLSGHKGIVYSVSWCPGESTLIAASSSVGELWIWDTAKRQVVAEYDLHGQRRIFRCVFNPDPTRQLIASCGEDGSCCVVNYGTGALVARYRHPRPTYGCDWSRLHPDLLATGCGDGVVRVFNMATKEVAPVALEGHTARVFNVAWSPLLPDTLISGSDDKTIRVWNVATNHQMCTRTAKVGPEKWDHHEKTTLAPSAHDLHEGFLSYPSREMTSLRGRAPQTVRLWQLEVSEAVRLRAFLGLPWASILGNAIQEEQRPVDASRALDPTTASAVAIRSRFAERQRLCGSGATELAARLQSVPARCRW
ncbi:putative Vegetative incompatibility protein HET-E-1 [Paratrimastix pyriformis]|uniref:Vegetative incompatibility protein HET-E-1 n=1 Tax=Paratrimastix pyriformis TaxID=342808 RepID=A0ABQ8UKT9_9EUKA|nr:putative Vegetative incompatibility protein HET-E-1 [Paratrimastix pyriformis]